MACKMYSTTYLATIENLMPNYKTQHYEEKKTIINMNSFAERTYYMCRYQPRLKIRAPLYIYSCFTDFMYYIKK